VVRRAGLRRLRLLGPGRVAPPGLVLPVLVPLALAVAAVLAWLARSKRGTAELSGGEGVKQSETGGNGMNCPVCREVSLVMSERQGIEIDYCPRWRGVWLDRGELDKIMERSSRRARRTDERAVTGRPARGPRPGSGHDTTTSTTTTDTASTEKSLSRASSTDPSLNAATRGRQPRRPARGAGCGAAHGPIQPGRACPGGVTGSGRPLRGGLASPPPVSPVPGAASPSPGRPGSSPRIHPDGPAQASDDLPGDGEADPLPS